MILKALAPHPRLTRAWYAADEPVLFHLSCLRREGIRALPRRAYLIAFHGTLETLFARRLDGAIGVGPTDTRALRAAAGARSTATIPNGVCCDYFRPDPSAAPPTPNSLAFWGTMDFEPNADAVLWFARRVWPRLLHQHPDATWRIIGKNPTPAVRALDRLPGIHVLGAKPDVRPEARASAAAILPMRCGAGIKNKLLEAAAMGMPIVASPRATRGLRTTRDDRPMLVCRSPDQWARAVTRLWNDPALRRRLGRDARAWVQRQYAWSSAADQLLAWLTTLETPNHRAPGTPRPRRWRPAPQPQPQHRVAA